MATTTRGPTILDTRDFFNQDELSDIMVRLANGERKLCHFFILCSKSKYFKQCFLDGTYKREDGIDLREHEPTAVKAVLRYIYTFEYGVDEEDLFFHVRVAKLAYLFDMDDLEAKALARFDELAREETDVKRVLDLLYALRDESNYGCAKEILSNIGLMLREKLYEHLKEEPDFALLEDDKELMRRCLSNTAFAHRLVLRYYQWCMRCGAGKILSERSGLQDECCGVECLEARDVNAEAAHH